MDLRSQNADITEVPIERMFLVLALGLCLVQATNAAGLSSTTSSVFDLVLFPTPHVLGAMATASVETAMRESVLLSTSTAKGFEFLFDIDVVLQKVQWIREENSTVVKFEIHSAFLDRADGSQSAPSQFSLDSLIVRTFSQPSSKAKFLGTLGLSQDSSLMTIDEISIELGIVDDIPQENTNLNDDDDNNNDDDSTLSRIDVILITVSGIIFFCLLCIIYGQHREQDCRQQHQATNGPAKNVTQQEEGNPAADNVNSNIVEPDSILDLPDVMVIDVACHDEEIVSRGDSDSTADLRSVEDCEDDRNDAENMDNSSDQLESPPLSPYSSEASSTSSDSCRSPTSPMLASELVGSHATDYILGAPKPNYSHATMPAMESQTFTTKLLRFPVLDMGTTKSAGKGSPCRSYASAPARLVSSSLSLSSNDGERSVRSAHSTSDIMKFMIKPHIELRCPSNSTDLAVIAEQSVLVAESASFEDNWQQSEKLAREDDDDSSTEDVFHIDVESQVNTEDNQSKTSGVSAVSEWLKSVRVVGDSPGARTSDMSNSSAENSSIEPRSVQMQENSSVAFSLERSLATSIVDV